MYIKLDICNTCIRCIMCYYSKHYSANADSYKDDGNYNFKKKKYRWAIDNYTKAILEKCNDRELNAILYSNRAAAQYHIGKLKQLLTLYMYPVIILIFYILPLFNLSWPKVLYNESIIKTCSGLHSNL